MSVSANTTQLAPTVTAVPPSTTTGHGDLQRARTPTSAKVGAWDQPLTEMGWEQTLLFLTWNTGNLLLLLMGKLNFSHVFQISSLEWSWNPLTAPTSILLALEEPRFGLC